jgi:serine/threonine-protein kinase HipA
MGGRAVGTLGIDARARLFFAYERDWIESGFNLSPHTMDFVSELQPAKSPEFNGLHGAFNDSLPDGWGLRLMDRALTQGLGWDRGEVTPLDRLAFMGSRPMGALEYEPEFGPTEDSELDLAQLATDAEGVIEGATQEVVRSLIVYGGSPGGARPKVTVAMNTTENTCVSGHKPLRAGFEHWIVKFRTREDPVDSGRAERAYAKMAGAAGIEMPETTLVDVTVNARQESFFAVKRFDRLGAEKLHMLSMGGHLYASHRAPTIDYDIVIAATQRLTQSVVEARKAFALMVFNATAHNRDDHSKNFAFTRSPAEGWQLSPAFDLTMSTGINGQHTTAINGSGDPVRSDIDKVANKASIDGVGDVVEKVLSATGRWAEFADEFDVSRARSAEINKNIERMRARIGLKAGARRSRS